MLALLADFLTESVIKTTFSEDTFHSSRISTEHADLIMGVPFIGLLSENGLVLFRFYFMCLFKSLAARSLTNQHEVIFWPRSGYLGKKRPAKMLRSL